jgi:hypothetical protein
MSGGGTPPDPPKPTESSTNSLTRVDELLIELERAIADVENGYVADEMDMDHYARTSQRLRDLAHRFFTGYP